MKWHNTSFYSSMNGVVLGNIIRSRSLVEKHMGASDAIVSAVVEEAFPLESREAVSRIGMPLDVIIGIFRCRLNQNLSVSRSAPGHQEWCDN